MPPDTHASDYPPHKAKTKSKELAIVNALGSVPPGASVERPRRAMAKPSTMQNRPSNCCNFRDLPVFSIVTWPRTGMGDAACAGVTATVNTGIDGVGGNAGETGVTCNPLTFDAGCHLSIPFHQTSVSALMRPSFPKSARSCDEYGPNFSPSFDRCHDLFASPGIERSPVFIQ